MYYVGVVEEIESKMDLIKEYKRELEKGFQYGIVPQMGILWGIFDNFHPRIVSYDGQYFYYLKIISI